MNCFYGQSLDKARNRDQSDRKRWRTDYRREVMVMKRRSVIVVWDPAAIGIGKPVAAKKHGMGRTLRGQEKRLRDMEADILDKQEEE